MSVPLQTGGHDQRLLEAQLQRLGTDHLWAPGPIMARGRVKFLDGGNGFSSSSTCMTTSAMRSRDFRGDTGTLRGSHPTPRAPQTQTVPSHLHTPGRYTPVRLAVSFRLTHTGCKRARRRLSAGTPRHQAMPGQQRPSDRMSRSGPSATIGPASTSPRPVHTVARRTAGRRVTPAWSW